MTLKQQVYQQFTQQLDEKIRQVEQVLDELFQSAALETKSTAGDKHETALAMLQIEQQNKRGQLAELRAQRGVLQAIDPLVQNKLCSPGALITTNHGLFFISVALGKIAIDGQTVFALSVASPLGQKLSGLRERDHVLLNEKTYHILKIE